MLVLHHCNGDCRLWKLWHFVFDQVVVWVAGRVELVVLTVIVTTTVEGIEHALGKTLLAVGRTTQEVNHAPSHSTQNVLLVFKQFSIWLTVQVTFDGTVGHNNEW